MSYKATYSQHRICQQKCSCYPQPGVLFDDQIWIVSHRGSTFPALARNWLSSKEQLHRLRSVIETQEFKDDQKLLDNSTITYNILTAVHHAAALIDAFQSSGDTSGCQTISE